ncbi:nanos homolog 1-like [Limulus polyphemus]|uniref:Nanos homolog 1-like n=1 Tax=Limulus polyphemus TaxID=6850 RepID=A0ABM1T4T2_LIMPO|nr:nanos homolog 1-like [Limulus polyphemus]
MSHPFFHNTSLVDEIKQLLTSTVTLGMDAKTVPRLVDHDDFQLNGRDTELYPETPDQLRFSHKCKQRKQSECVFCKKNGETVLFYRSHVLRNDGGKIVCPVLRRYNCPLCNNGGGDNAHTIRYCPNRRISGKKDQTGNVTL